MQDIVFNVIGMMLHEEAKQLENEAQQLHSAAVRLLLGLVNCVGEQRGDEDCNEECKY